ncbi:DUF6251 family protein [Streptomyces sp. KR80]|uniref:DUF6251 family protein n=1 Tax=Streptomyces sp. KR80 TaxID=3457426 RepID=UPI003FD3CBCC
MDQLPTPRLPTVVRLPDGTYAYADQAALPVQQATQPICGCQHGPQASAVRSSSWTPGKVAAVAGAVCVCGAVATTFFLAAAIAFPSIAASLLVLWKLYQSVLGGKR